MKLINHCGSTLLSTICFSLLSILGFSCSSESEVMYGMPPSDFEIKGSVTDEARQAVKDAEIRVTAPEVNSDISSAITTKTNRDGQYSISLLFYPELKVVCIPKESNLRPDSAIITVDRKLNDVNFILKAKESETD